MFKKSRKCIFAYPNENGNLSINLVCVVDIIILKITSGERLFFAIIEPLMSNK